MTHYEPRVFVHEDDPERRAYITYAGPLGSIIYETRGQKTSKGFHGADRIIDAEQELIDAGYIEVI